MMVEQSTRISAMPLFGSLVFFCLLAVTSAMPMQFTIYQRGTECLFETAESGESLTMSVFIMEGAELRATAFLEGPVAPNNITSGMSFQAAMDAFDQGTRYGPTIAMHEMVDFEHMSDKSEMEEEDDDDDGVTNYMAGMDDDDNDLPDTPENIAIIKKKAAERRRQLQVARQRAREARRRREAQRKSKLAKMRDEGEPFQKTYVAQASGWYRMCVRGTWYQISAEMELRKSSELGGIDSETGHVYTYEKKQQLAEEKFLDEDTASEEESIKDEDFEKTREQLRKLRRLLGEIQNKQQTERHRLVVHAATNAHSHSRMVLSSLLETVLFMLVTGFQVYTIRKWFTQSGSLLAR